MKIYKSILILTLIASCASKGDKPKQQKVCNETNYYNSNNNPFGDSSIFNPLARMYGDIASDINAIKNDAAGKCKVETITEK